MTNEEIITKMSEDMKLRNFSQYTYSSYMSKAKDVMKYVSDQQEHVLKPPVMKCMLST